MQRFINPYNFISLSDKPQRQQEAEGQKYTGSVTYRLRTRSSLFIPNTSSNKAFSYTPDKEGSILSLSFREARSGGCSGASTRH